MHRKEMLDQLATAGSVPLCRLSEEEMAAVGADERAPFRQADPPARLSGLTAQARDAMLADALRGLVGRGLIAAPERTAGGQVAGPVLSDELGVVLGIRRTPAAVVFAAQASSHAVLYGFREMRLTGLAPGISGFLEERVDQASGERQFTVRTVPDAVETLAALADPDGEVAASPPAGGEADAAVPEETLRALLDLGPGVTKLDAYHSRPEGTRRIQVFLLPRRREAVTLSAAAGPDPEQPSLFAVAADGLRRVIWNALCDPAGDLARDAAATVPGAETGEDGEMAGTEKPRYRCPVCGYPNLDRRPRSARAGASFEICPSCGFQFGYTDDLEEISYEDWRKRWVDGGMRWWSTYRDKHGNDPLKPRDWDPRAQLLALLESEGGDEADSTDS